MIRLVAAFLVAAGAAAAHDLSGLARVDTAESGFTDRREQLVLDLALSQPIPYRVFTLDAPTRLVIDFREVDWTGVDRNELLTSQYISDISFGRYQEGWSRLVAVLRSPFVIDQAGMATDPLTGTAELNVVLLPSTPDAFAQSVSQPNDPDWGLATLSAPLLRDGPPVVVIDPGHGGLDPGAERDGVQEADLMLALAIEVVDRLRRGGLVQVVLTRQNDDFVPLSARISLAREAEADLFISLHADALEEDEARGASVYTLSEDSQNRAAQRMAERHDRGDILAGVDLAGQGDRIATVLMDLARAETGPAENRFAELLVENLRKSGARLNSRPRREGLLAVLTPADFATVLLETGFLSSAEDRAMLSSSDGRAPLVTAIGAAVEAWVAEEDTRRALSRQ